MKKINTIEQFIALRAEGEKIFFRGGGMNHSDAEYVRFDCYEYLREQVIEGEYFFETELGFYIVGIGDHETVYEYIGEDRWKRTGRTEIYFTKSIGNIGEKVL